jgi:signal transduction histidine kinase
MTAIALLLWMSKAMYPGFGRWTMARLIDVLTVLFSVQIGVWPYSILFADACGILASILTLEACREFIGLKPSLRWTYAGAAAIMAQLIFFEVFLGSSQSSYVEMSFAWGAIYVWTGVTLLRNLPESTNKGRIATGSVYVVNGLFYVARAVYFVPRPAGTLADSSFVSQLFLIENMLSRIAAGFAFILMHYERVLDENAKEVGRTAQANESLRTLQANLEERVRLGTAELLQAQKLESVGRLAGGIAHDFNNILTVINGYSDLLLRELRPNDPQYEPLAQIGRAGERAAALTRQLLTFSRQQKDELKISSVRSVINGMMEMLRRLIGEDIVIVFEPGADAYNVRADKGQLEQVVMNLAINARDAMPNGGKLFITCSSTCLADDFGAVFPSATRGSYVVMEVTDTGSGMSVEVQERLFEPFFTTKGPDKGTGLGLATVYGIVRQSGGAITVQSAPGAGTTFRVLLPSSDGALREFDSLPVMPGSARGSETILVVEDQTDLRNFVRRILVGHGYRTLDAGSGVEAIAIAARHSGPIHLVLTDLVLPGIDGIEVARRIVSDRPGVRVLTMSGYADRVNPEMDQGTPLIHKPFSADALLRQVRSILDGVPV